MGVYPGRHTNSTVSSTFSNMRSDRFCLTSHCFSCDPISRFNLRLVFKCFRHYINFGFGQLIHFASRILRYCRETDILHTTSGFVFFIFPSCHTLHSLYPGWQQVTVHWWSPILHWCSTVRTSRWHLQLLMWPPVCRCSLITPPVVTDDSNGTPRRKSEIPI